MKNEKLINAIGEIKDEYIIESNQKKISNFIKWSMVSCFILVTIIGSILLYYNKESNNTNNPKTAYISASFSIDISDKKQTVGDADYVFIAKVKNTLETIYEDPVQIETESGYKEVSSPYTLYSVKVIDNIKGELKNDTAVEIEKSGGLSEDGSTICLYENDELLTDDNYYILLGYGQEDGSLLVSGPNSSIQLDIDSIEDIQTNDKVKEYENAFENEIVTDRVRSKSKYEN